MSLLERTCRTNSSHEEDWGTSRRDLSQKFKPVWILVPVTRFNCKNGNLLRGLVAENSPLVCAVVYIGVDTQKERKTLNKENSEARFLVLLFAFVCVCVRVFLFCFFLFWFRFASECSRSFLYSGPWPNRLLTTITSYTVSDHNLKQKKQRGLFLSLSWSAPHSCSRHRSSSWGITTFQWTLGSILCYGECNQVTFTNQNQDTLWAIVCERLKHWKKK